MPSNCVNDPWRLAARRTSVQHGFTCATAIILVGLYSGFLSVLNERPLLLIQGNRIHHNGNNGLSASQHCDNLTIRSISSWANTQNGIVLIPGSDHCLIANNQSYR